MSPVVLCFGALDAAVIAQAAYAARELRSGGSKEEKPERPVPHPFRRD